MISFSLLGVVMSSMALSPEIVKFLTCPDGKTKITVFDSLCKNLVIEVNQSGRKTYYFRYKDKRNVTRQPKLSDANDITLKQVRSLTDKYRGMILMGEDPWVTSAALKHVPTIADFIANSYLPYIKTYKRSWDTDVSLINNHILPNFGKLYLDAFTKQDMIAFIGRHAKTHAAGSVNRVIILLRYIFNCAIRWETAGVSKNPTAGIPMLEENNHKERYLTGVEANALVGALKHSDNQMLQYIIPMLILTGARKNEVLKAKWEDFNIEQRIWRIPLAKSGKARHVPMSDGVLSLLDTVPMHDGCPYVFANPKTLAPYVSFYISWNTVRKSVGLSDVRVHDLRHSFASFLVNSGRSLYEVQRILGHTQIKTTQRYAHLSQDSLLAAANEISKAVPLLNVMPSRVVDVPLLQVMM
jgi:integrase